MISYTSFLWLLYVMSALALVVFVALYFIKAGYVIFRTARWGWAVNNLLAVIFM